jgi:hypothetical protein
MRAHVKYTSKRSSSIPSRIMDGYEYLALYFFLYCIVDSATYFELVVLPAETVEQQMSIYLHTPPPSALSYPYPYPYPAHADIPPPNTNTSPEYHSYLRLNQHQINKQHDKVMLNILVGEALAARTLREADPAPQGPIVGGGVGRVERLHGVRAFYADVQVLCGRRWWCRRCCCGAAGGRHCMRCGRIRVGGKCRG